MKNPGRFAKVFSLVFAVLFLVATHPRFIGIESNGLFTHFQNSWQDFMFAHGAGSIKPGDPRLILVAVDAETGKKFGFPLPRPVYARMLDKLRALKVRVVLFDVMFFEPREGDKELAAASRRFGRVIHLFAQDLQQTEHGVVATTNLPVAPLLMSTKYIGHPNVDDLIDEDGHLRRFSLFRADAPDPLRKDFRAISSVAATLAADQDKTYEQIRGQYGEDILNLNFRSPTTWLAHEKRDTGSKISNPDVIYSPYRRISLLDILSGELTPAQKKALDGSVVIVGSTALGYYDHYPTPFLDQAPGAEFLLNAIDNCLHGDSMRSWSRGFILVLVLLAIGLTYFLQMVPAAYSAAAAGAALLAWAVLCAVLFRRGVIVEFVPPALAFVISYLVLTVHRVRTEGAEKKAIKSLFGQFVSPEVVAQLADDPSKVKLGGDKVDLTIFFLDIAHFTNLSEKMDPTALIQFLNRYLSALSGPILDSHGTIDKFIGDCIMAFWNAPVRDADHRADAVLSALACQDIIKELNKTLDPGIPEVPAVRIGINSGTATVGLTGTQRKLAYTAIGDEVNLASRLEGANKFFGSKILCSESTWKGCEGKVIGRYLGKARVVGKETPIAVYEPLAPQGKLDAAWEKALPIYERGVKDFDTRRYAEALESFKKFAELMPKDGPGQLYLRLSTDYAALPPDETWQGVFNLTAK